MHSFAMRKSILLTLKILGGVIAAVVVLLVVLGFVLNTSYFQNKILHYSTTVLSEKLDTQVCIDSAGISFFTNDVELSGVCVEDREQRKMLQMERLTVSMEFLPLLQKKVIISSAKISGLRAELYKPEGSPANYQFVIDAFKKDKQRKEKATEDDESERKAKKKVNLDVGNVELERISLKFNEKEAQLAKLHYKEDAVKGREVKIMGVEYQWVAHTKNGPQDCTAGIRQLTIHEKDLRGQLDISGAFFKNDNHQPRKNTGKPNRGAFDNGHMDATADLGLTFSVMPDYKSADVKLSRCVANDEVAGIHVTNVTLDATVTKENLKLKNICVTLPNTTVNIEHAELQLPNKKRGVKLAYSTSVVNGTTLLKDISQPFAPVLKNFSIPLTFRTTMRGDDNSMQFDDIVVGTTDKKLDIKASGQLKELKDKYKLDVRFHVSSMVARGDVKTRIINQFPVKKFMMKQVDALGNIHFFGDIIVLWKHEQFQGMLTTAVGKLNFGCSIDENTKYLTGNIKTRGIELGSLFDVDGLGPVSCSANFKFDISKPRTAIMRRKKGGKLPIGNVMAKIDTCSWKKVKLKNILAHIESDGAVADGKLTLKGKRTDVLCSFSFTNTESIKSKLKFKPGIRFHGLSEEDKQVKKLAKEQKRQEKEARKKLAAEEKAAKRARRAEERAAKKALRAEKRARKAEEKAAKKAASHSE